MLFCSVCMSGFCNVCVCEAFLMCGCFGKYDLKEIGGNI
jgi:hypothetical protein